VVEPKLQKLIRKADLPQYTGLQRTTIAELIKDGKFPKPIQLTDEGRTLAWLECEVLAWQASRIAQRDQS
jgi:prophage regulatory protein